MSIELKIKSKHLSEEAKIIRFEERKLLKKARWERIHQGHKTSYATLYAYDKIHQHRVIDVRNENRATFLARAYLEGKTYSSVESSRKPEKESTFKGLIFVRTLVMINRYKRSLAKTATTEDLSSWLLT